MPVTTTVRGTWPTRTSIVSPRETSRAGLIRSPPTLTWPARTRSVAALRVFANRAAHSHLSIRTPSIGRFLPTEGMRKDGLADDVDEPHHAEPRVLASVLRVHEARLDVPA